MTLADVAALIRDHPVAAALELGSLAICVLLVVATVTAVATGPPTGAGGLWLAVVVVGTVFVCFWTVGWPLYDRFRS